MGRSNPHMKPIKKACHTISDYKHCMASIFSPSKIAFSSRFTKSLQNLIQNLRMFEFEAPNEE